MSALQGGPLTWWTASGAPPSCQLIVHGFFLCPAPSSASWESIKEPCLSKYGGRDRSGSASHQNRADEREIAVRGFRPCATHSRRPFDSAPCLRLGPEPWYGE